MYITFSNDLIDEKDHLNIVGCWLQKDYCRPFTVSPAKGQRLLEYYNSTTTAKLSRKAKSEKDRLPLYLAVRAVIS